MRFQESMEAQFFSLPDPTLSLTSDWRDSIPKRFSDQALRSPKNIALISSQGTWTYGELEAFSNQLAHFLIDHGVQRGEVVAIYANRNAELAAALLGVLKTGAAFLILDSAYPAANLAERAQLAQCRAWVSVSNSEKLPTLLESLAKSPSCHCRINLLSNNGTLKKKSAQSPHVAIDPDDLAYVAFTSGSTGKPRGILGTHRPLPHFIDWHARTFELTEDDRFSMLSGLSHDPLLRDIFTPLSLGAALCIPDRDDLEIPGRLATWIEEKKVSVLHLTPAMGRLLAFGARNIRSPDKLALRYAFFGGDTLKADDVLSLRELAPSVVCVNFYGTTETPQVMGFHIVGGDDILPGIETNAIPIGRGIADVQLLVLDENRSQTSVGQTGEIYVRTPYLSRGYLDDEQAERERFLTNSFSGDAGDRVYRTGDLGRYRKDGTIDFVGRADSQIKIRGFRVNPGEVEAALRKHPAVSDCAVIAREMPSPAFSNLSEEKTLAACFVSRHPTPPSTSELRDFLKERLPDFMVPSILVAVPALPLTPSGKLDRNALKAVIEIATANTTQKGVSPRNQTEEQLCQIWCDVLSLQTVGTQDDFFELGGHSLLAILLALRVREVFKIELPLRVLFECPTVELLASYITGEAQQNKLPTPLPQVQADPARRHEPFPLTDVQMAYWIGRGESFELGNVACHLYREIDIDDLDLSRFEGAFQMLIDRHEMLRVVVLPNGTQKILESVPPYLIEKLDLRGKSPSQAEEKLREVRETLSHQVLPADRWPLFELRVSQLDERRSRLHMSIDALITDALSLRILARELHHLYHFSEKPLPRLELSFRDYVLAETSIKDTDLYRKSAEYWEKRLELLPPAPELPLAKKPGSVTHPRFVRRTHLLDVETWERFKQFAQKSGVSPSAALFAAYAEMLAIWSKSPRFTVNLTLFNRLPLHPQVNDIVGDFTALTMLAVDFSKPEAFCTRARGIQEQLWDDLDHGYFNGLQVLRRLTQLRGSRVNMPVVFTSVVNLGDIDQNSVGWDVFGKVACDLYQTPQVWLDQTIKENSKGLRVEWDSLDELFPEGMLDTMFKAFAGLLEALSDHANAWGQTEFKLLADAEFQARVEANNTHRPVPAGLLHEGFIHQARQRPGDMALIAEERRFTYDELHRLSNTLARRIREAGALPNTLVAVVMEKGWEQVAAVLAILQSGAAYLPVDANLPKERIHHLLDHAKVKLLLTQPSIETRLEWPAQIQRFVVDDKNLRGLKAEPLDPVQKPEDIAYVIYTSGSTGLPKGVVIDHRGALNTIVDINKRFRVGPADRVLALSALNFDLSVYDIFGLLTAGGAIVMPESDAKRDPERWLQWIKKEKVTLWNSVPALMEMATAFAESRSLMLPKSLRTVLLAGDWIPVNLPDRIRKLRPEIEVVSLGGATETSIWSILFPIEEVPAEWKSIPYGKPMVNQQFHVLDERLRPCPTWVSGQLFTGGIGLAKGYWRDDEKTRASFITHPSTGERLYRTGDMGRYWPDGNIELLGREDFQVKISGYRIELGEIEAALAQHPEIREAVVIAHDDGAGQKRLVAYLVSATATAPSSEQVRTFLKDRLPDYMVPNLYVTLESLPLSPNGKVDRKTLPAPDRIEAAKKHGRVNPHTPTEEILAGIWKEVLKLDGFGVHDNFLELGGNSLQAIQILSRVRGSFQLDLSLASLFEAPTIAESARLIEERLFEQIDRLSEEEASRLVDEVPEESAGMQPVNGDLLLKSSRLSPAKRALLGQQLQGRNLGGTTGRPSIEPRPAGEPVPLSFAQQRLWFLDQLDSGRFVYNIPESLRFKGYLDVEALRRSLEEVIRRHEVLRTSFRATDGQPKVIVAPFIDFDLPLIDLQRCSGAEQDVQIRRRTNELIHWDFDLASGPLFKAELLRLDKQDHLLLVNMHHIVSDGWSLDVFHRELFALYEAFCENKPSPLPELPIQYGDYAWWQRRWLQGDIFKEQMAYWMKQLAHMPVLQLPLDRPRPSTQSFNGDQHSILMPHALSAAVKTLAQKEATTLHIFFLAVLQTLLQRYTSQDDIVVGSPISNRNHVETEGLIGFFVNSLVLRSDLSEDPAFREALQRVKETAFEAFANQELPFDKVVEAVNPERDPSLNPLFQVMYVFQDQPYSTHQLPGLSITVSNLHGRTSPFDLTLFMYDTPEGLRVIVEYNTDVFDASTIVRMAGHFQTLTESIVKDPNLPISKLELFTENDRRQILVSWNETDTRYPRHKCIHELFEEQVDRTPDATALIFEDQAVTYRELDQRANRLANRLRDLGVGPDMFVGFCVERSIEMIVAMLGILKAGGAYVPLDVRYPKDMLQYFITDTDAKVLITQRRLVASLPRHNACVLFLDEDSDELSRSSDRRPIRVTRPEHLAYVMYTSGSTGTPKGVCISHRGVVRLVVNTNYIHIQADDVFLQFAPVAFDASTFEIWGALLNGARLVLYPGQLASLDDLGRVLEEQRVTILWLTAGLFHQVVKENVEVLRPVRQLLAGGDVLSVPHCKKVLETLNGIRLINGYGPTECTTFSTCHPMTSVEDLDLASVPIGRPISNTQFYILDRHLNPVPVGVAGELHLGGDGLARGYLNSPEITEKKFIHNPFDPERSPRLYKTGDLVRHLPDGRIEFLGRIDGQIKIRGFRVEPGEIESVLGYHPSVRENLVIAAKDSFGNKRLVAYVVPKSGEELDVAGLRQYLKERFPDYMVPSAFLKLDSFPLTPNGKVDHKALPSPNSQTPELPAAYIAPRNQIESKLAEIWCDVLGLPRIGINDNFFDLGGHSLMAVQVLSRLKKSLNRYLPLTALFEAPTIEQLASVLERGEHQNALLLVPIQPRGSKPPIFWVHTLGGGGGGGLFRYKQAAELLGDDQPSFGIQAPAEPFKTIEQMATHYIEVIKAVQPAGPYHLAGYCFGANVAFEMAQQLCARGERVAFLGLMEAWAHSSHPGDYRWNFQTIMMLALNILHWLETVLQKGPGHGWTRIKRKILTLRRKIAGLDDASFPELDEVMNFDEYPQEFRKYAETHWKAVLQYHPKPYPGRATLFRVCKLGLFSLDPSLGWENLISGRLSIRITPGEHDTIFDQPHVQGLAGLMRECLEQARIP